MIVEERDDKRFINEQNEEAKEHNNRTDSSVIKDDLCELEWNNFNHKQFLIWSLICFVILSVLIGTEFAYRDPLFDANSKTVSHFQYESTSFKDFMIALAYFGEAEGVAATLFIFVPILSYSDGIITLMLIF